MLIPSAPFGQRRCGIIARKVLKESRRRVFASLLCIMRQLYIVSHFDFRRGKCAVIYCFTNGRATLLFHEMHAVSSFISREKERDKKSARADASVVFCDVNISFDISHFYLTLPRCVACLNRKTRTAKFFHSGNTRLASCSCKTFAAGLRDFDIPFALPFPPACVSYLALQWLRQWQNDRLLGIKCPGKGTEEENMESRRMLN